VIVSSWVNWMPIGDRTKLAAPEYNDVFGVWSCLHPAPMISRDTCSAEQPAVLVHVERYAADGVWLKRTRAEVMNKTKRGDNERSCSGELSATRGHWIISVRSVSAT